MKNTERKLDPKNNPADQKILDSTHNREVNRRLAQGDNMMNPCTCSTCQRPMTNDTPNG